MCSCRLVLENICVSYNVFFQHFCKWIQLHILCILPFWFLFKIIFYDSMPHFHCKQLCNSNRLISWSHNEPWTRASCYEHSCQMSVLACSVNACGPERIIPLPTQLSNVCIRLLCQRMRSRKNHHAADTAVKCLHSPALSTHAVPKESPRCRHSCQMSAFGCGNSESSRMVWF